MNARTSRLVLSLLAVLSLVLVPTGAAKDKSRIEFNGLIETLPAIGLVGDWVISGRTVHVSIETQIKLEDGVLADLDAFVEVKGSLLPDGSVVATQIQITDGPGMVRGVDFRGKVESLPSGGLSGDWMIGGITVHVSSATRIKLEHGPIALNAFTQAKGFIESDGSVTATEIDVEAAPGSTRQIDFRGFVDKLPPGGLLGDWVVNGQLVHATTSTTFKIERGVPAVDGLVDLKGLLLADGSLNATTIEVEAIPGSSRQFEFKGFVDALPDGGLIGDWSVSGTTVRVGNRVRLHQERGIAATHAFVTVKGMLLADGAVGAVDVRVEASPVRGGRVSLRGFVEALPSGGLIGDWLVSGRTVHVTADTRIKKKKNLVVGVNSFVDVKGMLTADGSLDAGSIKVKF
jgi:hypothetical protein